MNYQRSFYIFFVVLTFASQIFTSGSLFEEVKAKFQKYLEDAAGNVAGLLIMPHIVEIREFYKENCVCPEGVEFKFFQECVKNNFEKKVIGRGIKVVMQYYQEDRQGIVSDFGLQLQHETQQQAKEVQDGILNYNISPFHLTPSPYYQILINNIKTGLPKNPFADQLLSFASCLFDSMPLDHKSHFPTDFIKQSAIIKIYTEFLNFFQLKIVSNNNANEVEALDRFLAVLQHLLQNNRLQGFYKVIKTEKMIDFEANSKVAEKVLPDIVHLVHALELKSVMQARLLRQSVDRVNPSDDLNIFDPKEKMEGRFLEWQKEHEQLEKSFDKEYEQALHALESATLCFEIERAEHTKILEKFETMKKNCSRAQQELLTLEQKKWNDIFENFQKELLSVQEKIQKRREQKVSQTAHQVVQDCYRLWAEYLKKVEDCENDFILKLKQDDQLQQVCESNRLIQEVIERRRAVRQLQASQRFSKDLLLTSLHESASENLIFEREAELNAIQKEEQNCKAVASTHEKQRTSLSTVQKFMGLVLNRSRNAKNEIENIKKNQRLENLQTMQLENDAQLVRSPLVPRLSFMSNKKLPLKPEGNVPQDLLPTRFVHNPYEASLIKPDDHRDDDANYREVEQNSNHSDKLGNFWTQDEHGNWYHNGCPVYFDPHTNAWSYYPVQPVVNPAMHNGRRVVLPGYNETIAHSVVFPASR